MPKLTKNTTNIEQKNNKIAKKKESSSLSVGRKKRTTEIVKSKKIVIPKNADEKEIVVSVSIETPISEVGKTEIEKQSAELFGAEKEKYKLVVAVVNRGFSSEVVEASQQAGNDGAIILQGRGVGKTEKRFFGLRIEPENEVVMIAVPEQNVLKVSKEIYRKIDFKSDGRGLVFILPISYIFI